MLIIYLPRRNRNGCVPSLGGGGGGVGVGEATARCLLATYYNIYLIFISNFFCGGMRHMKLLPRP